MTQDEIIDMARQAGFPTDYNDKRLLHAVELEAFAKLVAEAEREACAEVCDDIHAEHEVKGVFSTYAEAIRARSEA